jgi:peptidyl-prolyl cis-trans isomerase SurA
LTAVLAAGCSAPSGTPANVVARVNGIDITAEDLEEQFARNVQGVEPAPDDEEADDLKLQLLNEMITNQILMQLAAERDLTATDAEVDVRFNEFKSQYSAERFQELLDEQRMTTDDVRQELRDSLTIEKLVNMEITSKISVSEADIEEFYNGNTENFNLPETFYISHILVTPVPEPDLNNLEGDDATSVDEARAKATRLLREVQQGQDFGTMARRFSEDPSSVPSNGEIGFQPMESIVGVDPALADAVTRMRVGETYPSVIETRFGFHLLKLIDRDDGGQKDLTDTRVEAEIRQLLFQRRDQLLRGAFYEQARNSANIENLLAQRILSRTF